MLTASSRRLSDVISLDPMTDAETTALVERARLSMTLVLFAASREIEGARSSDHRYAEAAASIKQIAATMGMVSDDVLLKLATANQLSEGLLSQLIATRLSEVGGALPLYDDAKAFFQPLVEQVDQKLTPGTVLVREWDRRSQRVMVMADGFAWNGQTYDSLSKVAFAITGTNWTGPRFFGLRDKEDRSAMEARP